MTVCYWCGAKDTLADVGKELDDGKYKMVQCSKCKNAYYVLNKEKVNKPKQMTNEEWLLSATTEQLVEWLSSHSKFIYDCGQKQIIPKVLYEEDWEWWLKQPHKKE